MLIPPNNDKYFHRYYIVIGLILLTCPAVLFRLYDLHITRSPQLEDLAKRQHHLWAQMKPERGQILDRNGKVIATSLKVPSVYAVPRQIPKSDREALAKKLAPLLDLDSDIIEQRLSRDKSFIWLKRRVSPDVEEKVRALKHRSIGVSYETKRFYPNGRMFSNLLGVCDIDDKGIDGLELRYNKVLTGRGGYRRVQRDAMGRELVGLEETLIPAIDGHQLRLTIDEYIQFTTEKALRKAFERWNAKGGMAIVQDPKTGKILASVSLPNFEPNSLDEEFDQGKRHRPVVDYYEPGSIFKIVTAAGAINEGVIKEDDTIFCENGEYRFTKYRTLHDVHGYGDLSFKDVISKSSNIGTVKVAQKLGEQRFYDYMRAFGFGSFSGIDFPGEVAGVLRSPDKWSKYSISSLPIGQEITVTPLQITGAMSVVANGGKLMKPYYVEEIIDSKGVTIKRFEPEEIRQVITPETSHRVKKILQSVVEEGTGSKAAIRGISVGGKTGTAQKILPQGGYSHSSFVASFIAFAPVEHPLLVVSVMLDDPKPVYYGGSVAAPVVREILQDSLFYLGYVGEDPNDRSSRG